MYEKLCSARLYTLQGV